VDDKQALPGNFGAEGSWFVTEVQMDMIEKRRDIFIDFEQGQGSAAYNRTLCEILDTGRRSWRRLSFLNGTSSCPRSEGIYPISFLGTVM